MFSIIGDWDLIAANGQTISYWQFTDEGKFTESSGKANSSTNTGTWEMKDDLVVIKYTDVSVGHAVLSFEDENRIVGENRHKNGNTYSLALQRVDTQFAARQAAARSKLIDSLS